MKKTHFWGCGKTKSAVLKTIGVMLVVFLLLPEAKAADLFKITAYCACQKCCGKSPSNPAYGITASGKKVQYGYCAINWLPFGTKVHIKGLGTFIVMDRGAKSLFGSKNNHIKHIDIYLHKHKQAWQFGVKYLEVEYDL